MCFSQNSISTKIVFSTLYSHPVQILTYLWYYRTIVDLLRGCYPPRDWQTGCGIDVESPTKADETMLLPLAQKLIIKMSKVFDWCASKQVRTELVEGLGNTYGFDMARKESMKSWLIRVLYHMFYYDKPLQDQLGVMALLEAHEWNTIRGWDMEPRGTN